MNFRDPAITLPLPAKMEMDITRSPEKLYMMSCNDLCRKFCADSHGDNEKAGKKNQGFGVEIW